MQRVHRRPRRKVHVTYGVLAINPYVYRVVGGLGCIYREHQRTNMKFRHARAAQAHTRPAPCQRFTHRAKRTTKTLATAFAAINRVQIRIVICPARARRRRNKCVCVRRRIIYPSCRTRRIVIRRAYAVIHILARAAQCGARIRNCARRYNIRTRRYRHRRVTRRAVPCVINRTHRRAIGRRRYISRVTPTRCVRRAYAIRHIFPRTTQRRRIG